MHLKPTQSCSNLTQTLVYLLIYIGTFSADYIKVCNRNDSQIDACMKNAVETLRPKLVEGIEELSVPPLEPLKIEIVRLSRGPQNARVDLNITDLLVWGPGDFVIQSIK